MAPGRRLSRHGLDARSGNSPVRCWIRAHGIDNVQLTVLQECDSRDELLAAEMTWICHYRSRSRDLLNRTDGGDGVTGWSPSDVTRARIAASLTGIRRSPETRARVSRAARAREARKRAERQALHDAWWAAREARCGTFRTEDDLGAHRHLDRRTERLNAYAR
jgi:hypothetical protein